MTALQRAQARLQEWIDEETRLSNQIGDAHKLSPEMRKELWERLDRAREQIEKYETEVEYEETKLQIAEWKREMAK